MEKFCPACGKPGELVESLCPQCFIKRKSVILSKKIKITKCSTCDKLHEKGKWKKMSVNYAVRKNLKIEGQLISIDIKIMGKKAMLKIGSKINGILIEERRVFPLDLVKRQCPECEQSVSRSYAAILQLRGDYDTLVKRCGVCPGIIKVEELKEGVNFLFSTKHQAKQAVDIAKSLGATIKETHKEVTRKEGRRVSRITFAVRL